MSVILKSIIESLIATMLSHKSLKIAYSYNQNVYTLNQSDSLIFCNSMNMYEPFEDYTFEDIPFSVTHSQDNFCPGVGEGGSGSVIEVFTFNDIGTFTMKITEMYARSNVTKLITIHVKDRKELSKKKSCIIL